MLWWYWSILGLVMLGLEIITLGGLGNFYFLFFGIGALLVSALVWSGLIEAFWLQWALFPIFGVSLVFALRSRLQPKRSPDDGVEPVVDTMIGEVATVLEDLTVEGVGKAELRGSTWTVKNAGHGPLVKGQRAQVLRVDGLTLLIQAEPRLEEGHHVG